MAKIFRSLGLLNIKKAFYTISRELINLHIDKQYEMNDDPGLVARFYIFRGLETLFIKWVLVFL